jgi:uncharacterized protein
MEETPMKVSQNLTLIFVLFTLVSTTLLLSGCVKPQTTMIAMRDGTKLATDVYAKKGQQPHGTVLIRTPYNKGTWDAQLLGNNFAKNGWPCVIQDMRGRYASEGNDTVFRNEYTDGPDTISWITNQSFSNGKVVTFGGSALGITQYLTAGSNPPGLACQYIQVATPNLYTWAMYQGGELRRNLIVPWLQGEGSTYILPDVYLHENSSDPYWSNVSITTEFSNVNVPAIHIGGWYDIFTQGIIDGWDGYQHHGGLGAVGKSKLIIGPWTHGGMGSTTEGQLTYPKGSADNFSQVIFWAMVNQYTEGSAQGYDDYPAVTYYVMGDTENPDSAGNFWRHTDDWPPASTPVSWYFNDNHTLSETQPLNGGPFTYQYDPLNPVPTLGGQELFGSLGPYDQRPVENRSDVILFTSPVFSHPFEATGRVHAILYVSSDCVDTDFTVKLSDVYPDGRSMLICDGILRMRDRNGTDHWELMNAGTIYRVEVDLMSTSYMWDSGHAIRVAASSSNSPRFLANPNTADGIARNTTSVIANNSLYADADHPSCLVLPWIPCNASVGEPGIESVHRFPFLDRLDVRPWLSLISRHGV